jgi:hypothetical protein
MRCQLQAGWITHGSLLEIADRGRDLAGAGAVGAGNWSLAQICQHLALSIEATLVNSAVVIGAGGASGSAERYGPVLRWLFRRIILTAGYIPRDVAVPDGAVPDEAAPKVEVAHLESAARAFEAAGGEPDRVWPGQRFMGPLSAVQWRRFHHVHAAHHFAFLVHRHAKTRGS